MNLSMSLTPLLSRGVKAMGPQIWRIFGLIAPFAILNSLAELLPEELAYRLSALVLLLLLYVLCNGALSFAISEAIDGRPVRWGASYQRAWKRYVDLFWVEIQYTVGWFWRVFLFVIPSFVYAMKYLLAPVHVVLSDAAGQDSFAASEKMTQGIRIRLFLAMILSLAPSGVLMFEKAKFASAFPLPLYLFLGTLVSIITTVIFSTLEVAVYRARVKTLP